MEIRLPAQIHLLPTSLKYLYMDLDTKHNRGDQGHGLRLLFRPDRAIFTGEAQLAKRWLHGYVRSTHAMPHEKSYVTPAGLAAGNMRIPDRPMSRWSSGKV